MMDSNFDLPPGWASSVDQRTGRQYFINMLEKTTTWEDPRIKYKHLYGPSIPMQTLHGSPKNVIFPAHNYPTQAFQHDSGQSIINASPVPSTKASHYSQSHTVEMSSLSRSSPHTPRVGNLIKNQHQHVQETSFSSSPTPMETEATVSKINAMFPTASEHHIRLLLKKYHNREAVVISALQVEKHPTHTPGPNTPPPPRSFHSTALALSAFATPPSSSALSRKGLHHLYNDHLTLNSSSNGSPILRPQSSSSYYASTAGYYGSPRYGEQFKNSPKPHSSPKMKLRYLKSMFPRADENIILDVLATVENNVQKASEQLLQMGYEKKEITPAPRLSHRKKDDGSSKRQQQHIEATPPQKPKSADEKKKLKIKLQSQYKETIPERVILMALESVDYSEEKALKILDAVLDETRKSSEQQDNKKKSDERNVSFVEPSVKSNKSIDLDKAAAIENDETMIINSDHTIITTPIESPQTNDINYNDGETPVKSSHINISDSVALKDDYKIDKDKKKRNKARNETARNTKKEQKDRTTVRDSSETSKKSSTEASKKSTISKSIVFEETKDCNYMSIVTKCTAQGPNAGLAKGPKDDLLLVDYVSWSGANPDMIQSSKVKPKGPNSALLIDKSYTPRGANNNLCKGPKIGLAMGSIYSRQSRPDVACN